MIREFRPDAAFVAHFAYHLSPAVVPALGSVPTVVSMMDYKVVCPMGTKLLPGGSICSRPAGVACRQEGCTGTLHWLRDQPRYALIRSGLRHARQVISPSAWMQAELRRNGVESECIPIPVRGPSAGYVRRPDAEPTFTYVGRLSREKGVDVLVRAFSAMASRHPAACLRIVGDGPMHNELQRLAASTGVASKVDFRGRVSPDRVEESLADAWALVAPSVWAEPYGLVAPEAILHGVPVIATSQRRICRIGRGWGDRAPGAERRRRRSRPRPRCGSFRSRFSAPGHRRERGGEVGHPAQSRTARRAPA